MTEGATRRAIDAVWRIEAPRLIGGLTRLVRDVGLAEDLAQEALVAALERWPVTGIPDRPGAWLMATARNRAIDQLRRGARLARRHEELEALGALTAKPEDLDGAIDAGVPDDLLRLLFVSCHPALPREGRLALTLKLLCGLTTDEIARAFLVPEPTVAQRIVRAQRTLRERQVPFEIPGQTERADRLESVLEVVYLVFNEGYAATSGAHWTRPALCGEALRLGRMLAALLPGEAEVHGLLALMELQSSRAAARVGPGGEAILLPLQDRRRWDGLLIRRGLAAIDRAARLGGAPGPYLLQAAIAACHARARTSEQTDWGRIAALYAVLEDRLPSPVVRLNRAVAVGMAEGPEAGLRIVDSLVEEGALSRYHLLPSVRADLLIKLGRLDEARDELARAAAMTKNEAERALLQRRADETR